MGVKKWEQLKHATLSIWCIFQKNFGHFSLRNIKEKENGIGKQSYTTALDSGSGDMPWPERHLNTAKEIIHAIHMNKGPTSVFILDKI